MPRHKKGHAAKPNTTLPHAHDDESLDEYMLRSLNDFLDFWMDYEQEEKYFKEKWEEDWY